MIYSSGTVPLPDTDVLSLLFDSDYSKSTEDTPLHAEASHPDHILTKRDVRNLTQQFAHFFRSYYGIGINKPDSTTPDVVVTISLGQSALPSLFYSVIAAGGIHSGASPASTTSDLARQIKDGPGKVLVCSPELKDTAVKAAKEAGLPAGNVVVLESYPKVKLASVDGSKVCDFKGSLDWEKITDPHTLENRTACIVYSSGTTGLPKGVRMSHLNLVSNVLLIAAVVRPVTDRWEAEGNPYIGRTLAHLPTAHVAGIQGYLISPILDGTIVYWMPSFNFEQFVKHVADLEINGFFSVPPIFMGIAKHPAVTDQFKHLRIALSGAAPLSADMQAAVGKKFPLAEMRQTWGLSETSGAATYVAPDRTDTVGSNGPLLPNTYMRLVDEDGNDVPVGQPGEAIMKGPIVTKSYHNNDKANAESYTADGWYRTGDIIEIRNNLVYVVDRKKELIKYKGLQVAPAELEGILISHPQLTDAAVIGVQDSAGNEVPRAFVVVQPGTTKPPTADEIKDYVKKQVAPYKQLRGGIVFLDVVPRSPSGKILRKLLRERKDDVVKSKL